MADRVKVSPLQTPIFRAIWLANFASNLGAMIQVVGASWAMTSMTTSPQRIALVQSSTALPVMLLSLLGGALADCLDRRRMMLGAQLFMLVISMTLSLCTWQGSLTPEALLAFTFLIGSGYAINNPAYQASVADMVPQGTLSAAIGLNSMSFNLARGVGPALGGMIIATLGIAAAFLVNALSFAGTIVVLSRWRPECKPT